GLPPPPAKVVISRVSTSSLDFVKACHSHHIKMNINTTAKTCSAMEVAADSGNSWCREYRLQNGSSNGAGPAGPFGRGLAWLLAGATDLGSGRAGACCAMAQPGKGYVVCRASLLTYPPNRGVDKQKKQKRHHRQGDLGDGGAFDSSFRAGRTSDSSFRARRI